MTTNWRAKAASAALLVVAFALAVRFASAVLTPAVPGLLVLGALAALYLFIIRGRR